MIKNKFPQLIDYKELKKTLAKLPKQGAVYAVSHWQDNIRKRGGMPVNGKLQKFKKRRYDTRLQKDKKILFGKGNMVDSIRIISESENTVVLGINSPATREYAKAHQEGAEIEVTSKMKSFFWSQYYKNGGKESDNPDANFWRAMALKKEGSKIKIPERKFMEITPDIEKGIFREFVFELDKFFNEL
ncbi:phage virion morphogenesis protein [Bacteroidales bacterium OttesenSCG-928-C19]|nr:phage virion morphogenesis protein [Bacteroidales bacterium OttesenSCG-928-C19]